MSTSEIRGLSSIIIPCWNQLEFTQQCIAALKDHTRPPWELIVIDNGSTDHTADYLAGVRDMAAVPVTVVSNARNLGFPAAINQGLQVARGEYLVLLNNDVVVTNGWLDQLIGLANACPSQSPLQLAGGSVSEAAGPQFSAADDLAISCAETITHPSDGLVISSAETTPPPFVGPVISSAETTPPPFVGPVISSAETTPPGPPFTMGGKGFAAGSGDGTGAFRGSSIGLVGPMSNYAAPPQLVESVPYQAVDQMHLFARRWRDEHRGQWFTVPKLSGFCLLLKRAVYEAIGGLDERFGLGLFDDDDLAERARRAGFLLAVAHDLFVHHFGSRTFAGNGIDVGTLLDDNARRFADKWGLPGVNGRRVALQPWRGTGESRTEFNVLRADTSLSIREGEPRCKPSANAGSDGASPSRNRLRASHHENNLASGAGVKATVSLTMIVRDEEKNLPQCLESVRGIFDEIIIVDTGSTDRTVEIARSFGAKVFDFVWVDSFSAARNEALVHATGDFAFWLDADDVVEPGEREKLVELLRGLRGGDPAAYVVRCACDPSPDGTGGDTVVDHLRLFPVRDDARWTYRVHEQILPAFRQAKVPVRWTNLTVRHTGYVDQALRARKLERDIRLLNLDLADRPNDPFVLFNLGAIAVERQEWPRALGFLERSLARSAPTDSIVRKLFALIARTHQMMGDSARALRTCSDGLNLDPEDAELWFRKAVVHRHRGESHEAEQSWRRILRLHRPDQFCSVDQGIYGHLTRRNLAALAAERGDHAGAERLWHEVLVECPGDREAQAKVGRVQMATLRRAQPQSDDKAGPWIVPGSRRTIVPTLGPGEFDPYAPVAKAWVEALKARVVVELGVRFGHSTRALLEGARAVDGRVWGVDPLERHDVSDDRFTFIQADPFKVAARWECIDLLHVDVDSQCEGDARRWLAEYANRCRAIAVHHTHHPGYRLGPVISELAATDQWQVFEYRGNLGGWTVLARRGEICPDGESDSQRGSSLE